MERGWVGGMRQQCWGGHRCQGQQGFNRLNKRKWELFRVWGIFNEFAQKLIFHCNLLFICWRHVPLRLRVIALSRPPLLQTTPQSPGKMVFYLRQILSCLGLRGEKAVCSKIACSFLHCSSRENLSGRLSALFKTQVFYFRTI